MKTRLITLALSLPLCIAATATTAQSGLGTANCDFSQNLGTCEAATSPRAGGGIFIFTDSLHCASVDYVADGRKRRVYVTEGRGEDVTAKEGVSVLSCTKFANIQPVKPVQPVQPMQTGQTGQTGWKQPDGTIVGGSMGNGQVPTLSQVVPNSQPSTAAEPIPTPATPQRSGDLYQQLAGTWCDAAGQKKLVVSNSGLNLMHKPGKNIPAPFVGRDKDGMTYATKRLFTTYSGKIGVDARDGSLVWEDRVTPGISKVHFLGSC